MYSYYLLDRHPRRFRFGEQDRVWKLEGSRPLVINFDLAKVLKIIINTFVMLSLLSFPFLS